MNSLAEKKKPAKKALTEAKSVAIISTLKQRRPPLTCRSGEIRHGMMGLFRGGRVCVRYFFRRCRTIATQELPINEEIRDPEVRLIDENGVIIACSELVKIGEMRQGVRDELAYTSDAITSGGYTYKPIGSGSKWEYIVFIEGEDKYAEKIATILAVSLSNINRQIINGYFAWKGGRQSRI